MRPSVQKDIEREVFLTIARKTDEFEAYAHGHAQRVATLADEIGKIYNLASKDRHSLRVAALLHDLGEASMERDYIKRSRSLTDDERLDLARHPIIGESEVATVGADRAAQLIIRWHHEWWNGGGYPDALRRQEIPLAARILRVADSYASITDARPFRPAMSEPKARQHMADWAGIEFDPKTVRALLSLGPLKELESFAVTQTVTSGESQLGLSLSREPDLFSSFSR